MNHKLLPLVALGCAALIAFAPASQAASLNEKLMQCAVLKDSLERLVCFDALAKVAPTVPDEPYHAPAPSRAVVAPVAPAPVYQPQVAQPAATQPASAPAPQAATVPASKEDSFGKEHKEISKNAPERMTFTIAKIEKNPYGHHILTFKNGQKWKQMDDIHIRLSEDEEVIVTRGMFNAFYLKKTTSKKSIKVKRMD